jgi:hypothetical protein
MNPGECFNFITLSDSHGSFGHPSKIATVPDRAAAVSA